MVFVSFSHCNHGGASGTGTVGNGKLPVTSSDAPPKIEAASYDERKDFMEEICAQRFYSAMGEIKELMPSPSAVERTKDALISCELRESCNNNEWFHYKYKGINADDIKEEFPCCSECRKTWQENQSISFAFAGKDSWDKTKCHNQQK